MKLKSKKKMKYCPAVQAELDLHGLTQTEAENELWNFLKEAELNNWRHLRIIVGRGLNSQKEPVLPDLTLDILKQVNCRFQQENNNSGAILVDLPKKLST